MEHRFSGLPTKRATSYLRVLTARALVQGRIGIALRLGSAVDGTQAVQLSASARVIAAGLHGHRGQSDQGRNRWARAWPCGGRERDERVCCGGEWRAPSPS